MRTAQERSWVFLAGDRCDSLEDNLCSPNERDKGTGAEVWKGRGPCELKSANFAVRRVRRVWETQLVKAGSRIAPRACDSTYRKGNLFSSMFSYTRVLRGRSWKQRIPYIPLGSGDHEPVQNAGVEGTGELRRRLKED